jgi:outer membrane protein assembly factor BamA
MLQTKKYYTWLMVLLMASNKLDAQEPPSGKKDMPVHTDSTTVIVTGNSSPNVSSFTIRNIIISGNKRTKAFIILREIPFRPGEQYSLQDLVKKFEDGRRQLMNTSLFIDVVVALDKSEGSLIDVSVNVRERWYIFPVPYFKPVDRNLNQWLFEKNASLSRVNYGLKILHNNATGKNDKFKLFFVGGYTKQFSFSYDRLYIDKKLKWGLTTAFAIGKNREMNYNTVADKQVFFKDEKSYLHSFLNANFDLTYRRAIKTRHRIGIAYNIEDVKDTIISLNPEYFKSGRTRVQFPEIYYRMSYYDLDYIPYPTKGYAAELSAGKRGLNNIINVWYLSVKGSGSWHTGKKSFVNLIAFGTIKAPFKQPYFMQRFLGYGDAFMQGYEYYVVDGVAGGFLKATFTRELFDFSVRTPGIKKHLPERIPFRFFAKVFGNAGYVHNPLPGNNSLSNRMLYSGGIGLDIFTSYDFTLKLEWTFNQLGQNGLFLHRKSIF